MDVEAHGADGCDSRDNFQRVDDFLPLRHPLSLLESGFGVVMGKGVFAAAVSAAMSTASEGSRTMRCKFIQSCGPSDI